MDVVLPSRQTILQGLSAKPELNGKAVEVIREDDKKPGRMIVKVLSSGEVLSIHSRNICPAPSAPSAPDFGNQISTYSRTTLQGLWAKPELNGEEVEVIREVEERPGRMLVKVLRSGQELSISSCNICAVPSAPSAAGCAVPSAPSAAGFFEKMSNWWQRATGETTRTPKEVVTVMLGQTGSGKTSFLNLLCNYSKFIELGSAAGAAMRDFHDIDLENNLASTAESKTSAATIYNVQLGHVRLKVIDTPGFGDTRGQEYDRKHAKLIVDCIKERECIHAITLVISGRVSRMTTELKFVLSEICAILPANARNNIVVVFTNTANPLYLSFSIDEVSKLVETAVSPDRQIFVENAYVLWQRSRKDAGKLPDFTDSLSQVFDDAGKNLQKFCKAISKMPKLHPKDFEKLYNLRTEIEATTLDILTALNNVQQTRKQLEQKQTEISHIQSVEKLNEAYKRTLKGKRWVFKPADRHGTFCGVKDCHSNCHAPCIMEKTFDNGKFKLCSAFRYCKRKVELSSSADRDELLQHMTDQKVEFHTNQDGGEGTQFDTILKGENKFSFKGHSFDKGAMVIARNNASTGWAAKSHLLQLKLPDEVTICDESEQDTCKKCHHHRQYHYHDEKKWDEEDYEEEVVDNDTKERYLGAVDLKAKKLEMKRGIQAKIVQMEEEETRLCDKLLCNIREFEKLGLHRSYALILTHQLDLLKQHLESTVDEEDGKNTEALRKAIDRIERQLQIVKDALSKGRAEKDPKRKLAWAYKVLGVAEGATGADVEKQYRIESQRNHTDKPWGEKERMQMLNEAVAIVRQHIASQRSYFSWLG